MLLLRNYFNLLTMMSTASSDSSDSALPLNEEEAMKNAEMEQERHTEKLKKMDILSEVTHSGTDIKINDFRVTYKNVLVTMLQDKMYSVFPIPDRSSEYFDLYNNEDYVNAAFCKIEWMKHHLIMFNLPIVLASKEYVRERNRLWQCYPDNGGREGLVELVAVYNCRDKNDKYF